MAQYIFENGENLGQFCKRIGAKYITMYARLKRQGVSLKDLPNFERKKIKVDGMSYKEYCKKNKCSHTKFYYIAKKDEK